jgi:C1A family cysteine protease
MATKISRYGWLPDLPDVRDFLYATPLALIRKLPAKVDLTKFCPPVYDQGQLGSCTANAIGGAFEFELRKQDSAKDFMPSRLFIYYNERVIESSVNTDSGAMLRDGMKTVNKQGVCSESMWPYYVGELTVRPSSGCYDDALRHQVTSYHKVERNINQMKGCLAEGYPFVFGFSVYESFESAEVAQSGKVNMPKKGEPQVGGHAVMAVGFIQSSKRFIVRNSWGTSWGMNGYFTMPFDYLLDENLSDDFWTIRLVEVNAAKKK